MQRAEREHRDAPSTDRLLLRDFVVLFHRDVVENRVVVGNHTPKWRAVAGESSIELFFHRFGLHVITEYALAGVAIIGGGRRKGFEFEIGERGALVGTDGEMRREEREAARGSSITGVVKDANRPFLRYRHGGNSGLDLPDDEDLRADGEPAAAVVGQPSHSQPVIAGARIPIAVDIDHIARSWVDRGMIGAAQECIDSAELGLRLRAISVRYDNARRAAVQSPGVTAVRGAIQDVINVLRSPGARSYAPLEKAVHRAGALIDSKAVSGIDTSGAKPAAVINGKHERIGRRCDSDMHVGCSVEIVVGNIDVLAASSWLRAYEQPRLVLVVDAVEMVYRLGHSWRALKIVERECSWIMVERSVDVGRRFGEERAG